jgi:hypothetical protein
MNRNASWISGCLLLALGALAPVQAHHSVAGVFDVTKTIKLSGTVSRVDWINPHTYVYLDVKEPGGTVTTWKLESLPVAMMRKAGLSRQLIMGDGQHVAVDAHPARNGTPALGFILKMTYDDGRHYQFSRDPNDKPIFVQ